MALPGGGLQGVGGHQGTPVVGVAAVCVGVLRGAVVMLRGYIHTKKGRQLSVRQAWCGIV